MISKLQCNCSFPTRVFLLQAHSAHFFLGTCASPPTPTDGVARIFPLTPMPQLGIELTSAQLQLCEGPLFKLLYRLGYLSHGSYSSYYFFAARPTSPSRSLCLARRSARGRSPASPWPWSAPFTCCCSRPGKSSSCRPASFASTTGSTWRWTRQTRPRSRPWGRPSSRSSSELQGIFLFLCFYASEGDVVVAFNIIFLSVLFPSLRLS